MTNLVWDNIYTVDFSWDSCWSIFICPSQQGYWQLLAPKLSFSIGLAADVSCTNVTSASSLWDILMQTIWMLLVRNFTYLSATTGSGIMLYSNWHIPPITWLLCQCPTSLFNSLFNEDGAIVHVMFFTTILTLAFPGILRFFLSKIWCLAAYDFINLFFELVLCYLCSPSRSLWKIVGHWLTQSLLLQNLSDLRGLLVLFVGAFFA